MELAKVYEDLTDETCFKLGNVLKYVSFLETYNAKLDRENAAFKKSEDQGLSIFYLGT